MWPGVSCIKSSPPSFTPRRVARSMFICSERTTVASSRHENAVAAVEAGGRNGKYKTVHGLDLGTMLREGQNLAYHPSHGPTMRSYNREIYPKEKNRPPLSLSCDS